MKKFDYGRAYSDLYDCECPDPDEVYGHRSEKSLREFMGEYGLDARKYYRDDGKGPSSGSSSGPSSGPSGGDEGCFVTTACVAARGLADDCPELVTLRSFRDGYVLLQEGGAEDVAEYYRLAPAVVARVNARPDAGAVWDRVYREMVLPCVRLIREGRFGDAYDLYREYALSLGRAYPAADSGERTGAAR